MSFKRFAFMFVGAVIIIAGIVAVIRYFNTFQTLDVTFSEFSIKKATIYLAKVGDGSVALEYYKDQPLNTISKNSHLTLKKGDYVIVSNADSTYRSFIHSVHLGDNPNRITVSQDYTKEKLDAITKTESPLVAQALTKKYKRISLYTISPGKAYKQGQWYGTTLVYKDQSEAYQGDTLRVILKKENNQWNVVTDPPSISISKIIFPQIPGDVISDVDNL